MAGDQLAVTAHAGNRGLVTEVLVPAVWFEGFRVSKFLVDPFRKMVVGNT